MAIAGNELKNLNNVAGDHLFMDVIRLQGDKISAEEGKRPLRFVEIDDLKKTLR